MLHKLLGEPPSLIFPPDKRLLSCTRILPAISMAENEHPVEIGETIQPTSGDQALQMYDLK